MILWYRKYVAFRLENCKNSKIGSSTKKYFSGYKFQNFQFEDTP